MSEKGDVRLVLSMVRKDSIIGNDAYLLQVDIGGRVFFIIGIYRGDGTFAQEDGPNLDIKDVVRVFEKPTQDRIVEFW